MSVFSPIKERDYNDLSLTIRRLWEDKEERQREKISPSLGGFPPLNGVFKGKKTPFFSIARRLQILICKGDFFRS